MSVLTLNVMFYWIDDEVIGDKYYLSEIDRNVFGSNLSFQGQCIAVVHFNQFFVNPY